jgi:hypothetical protein
MSLKLCYILPQTAEDKMGAIDRPGGICCAVWARIRIWSIDAGFCRRDLAGVAGYEFARPEKILTRVPLIGIPNRIIGLIDTADSGLRNSIFETEVLVPGQVWAGPTSLKEDYLYPRLKRGCSSHRSDFFPAIHGNGLRLRSAPHVLHPDFEFWCAGKTGKE